MLDIKVFAEYILMFILLLFGPLKIGNQIEEINCNLLENTFLTEDQVSVHLRFCGNGSNTSDKSRLKFLTLPLKLVYSFLRKSILVILYIWIILVKLKKRQFNHICSIIWCIGHLLDLACSSYFGGNQIHAGETWQPLTWLFTLWASLKPVEKKCTIWKCKKLAIHEATPNWWKSEVVDKCSSFVSFGRLLWGSFMAPKNTLGLSPVCSKLGVNSRMLSCIGFPSFPVSFS